MKILYGVQGTGNGHISRARMMAEALKKYPVTVDYVFSGKDDAYFNMEEFGDYRSYSGLSFVARDGRIQYLNTLRRNNLPRFFRDIQSINVTDYDLVLSDFEPITAWAAKLKGVPCVGLSHQNAFRYPQVPKRGHNPAIALLMKWFAPADEYLGFHWHHFNQPILPPMIKTNLEVAPTKRNKILVYLPFLDQVRYHDLFRRFPDYSFHQYHPVGTSTQHDNIHCNPLSRTNFLIDFRDCSGLICGAGFSACSEAIHYGKKLMVLPLHGQMEQLSNAAALQSLGYGTVIENVIDAPRMSEWLAQPDSGPRHFPDVAAELAQWVVDGRQATLLELSRVLWKRVAKDAD